MVDGETYGCVKSFSYQGDTLYEDGGADLAATARIRKGWMKFLELLTSRSPPLEMTYGSETWSLLADVGLKFERFR